MPCTSTEYCSTCNGHTHHMNGDCTDCSVAFNPINKSKRMNDSIYYVLWDHQDYNGQWHAKMHVSFALFSSAVEYAKVLKETYPNVRNVEIAKKIDGEL